MRALVTTLSADVMAMASLSLARSLAARSCVPLIAQPRSRPRPAVSEGDAPDRCLRAGRWPGLRARPGGWARQRRRVAAAALAAVAGPSGLEGRPAGPAAARPTGAAAG